MVRLIPPEPVALKASQYREELSVLTTCLRMARTLGGSEDLSARVNQDNREAVWLVLAPASDTGSGPEDMPGTECCGSQDHLSGGLTVPPQEAA